MNHKNMRWVLGLGVVATTVYAAVSAYQSDTQRYYNRDAAQNATDIIGTLSCIINQTGVAQEVLLDSPQQSYSAWVDEDRCRAGSASSDSTASSEVSYSKYWVTHETVDGVIKVKWWEYGNRETYAMAEISQGVTSSSPYGVWKVDWCVAFLKNEMDGKSGDEACHQSGHAELGPDQRYQLYYKRVASGNINSYAKASAGHVASDLSSGYGRFSETLANGNTNVGYFGFSGPALQQSYNGVKVCKKPTTDSANTLHQVWDAWLYDPTTEARVSSDTGPFAVTRVSDGEVAWASHEGVFLSGSKTAESTGTFVRSEGNDKSELTAHRGYGKLVKKTVTEMPNGLADLSGLPLRYKLAKDAFPELTNNTGNNLEQYVMGVWDNEAEELVFTSYDISDSGLTGKLFLPYDTPVRFKLAEFLAQAQSQSRPWERRWFTWLPGSNYEFLIQLADAGTNNAPLRATPKVYRMEQKTVVPGSADMPDDELVCLGRCPRPVGGELVLENEYDKRKGDLESLPTYVFHADGSLTTGDLDVDEEVIDRDGIDTHREDLWLNDFVRKSDLEKLTCRNGERYCSYDTQAADGTNSNETFGVLGVTTHYAWNTGPYKWNRFAGLKDGNGDFVVIDQPMTLFYDVPDTDAFGASRGQRVAMSYPGNGKLWLPGRCVNITDATATTTRDCSETNETYIHDFVIPHDKDLGKVTDGEGKSYLVKWLRQGVFYPDHPEPNACDDISVQANYEEGGALSLPSADIWVNARDAIGIDKPSDADPRKPRYINGSPTYN